MSSRYAIFTIKELNFIANEILRFERDENSVYAILPYSEADPEIRIQGDCLRNTLYNAIKFVEAMEEYEDKYIEPDFWDDRTY